MANILFDSDGPVDSTGRVKGEALIYDNRA